MKKILIITALCLFSLTIQAQKHYDLDAPKTEAQIIGKNKKTLDTANLKGIKYAVYTTPKGKLFIVCKNKKNLFTKKYIN